MFSLIYGKFLRKLVQANNEKNVVVKLLHYELWETDLTKDDKQLGNITFQCYKNHTTPHKRVTGLTL